MNFLYKGEIQCIEEFDSLKIQENLHKIFGFPKFLGLRCQNVHDAVQEVDSDTIDRETPTPVRETQTPVSKSELTPAFKSAPALKSAPTPVTKTAPAPVDPTCDYKPVMTSPVIEPTPAPVHLLKARFSSNSSVVTPTLPKNSKSNQGSSINGEDFNASKETPTLVSKPKLTPSFTAPPVFKPTPTSAVTTTAALLNINGQTSDPSSDPVLDPSVLDHPVLDRSVLDHPVLDNFVLDHPVLDHPVLDHPVLDHPNLNHPMDHPMQDLTVLDHPVLDHPVLDHPFLDRSELDHPVLFDSNGHPLNPASIPLPPSVASALESINERVAMRQRKNQIMVISQIFSSKHLFFS